MSTVRTINGSPHGPVGPPRQRHIDQTNEKELDQHRGLLSGTLAPGSWCRGRSCRFHIFVPVDLACVSPVKNGGTASLSKIVPSPFHKRFDLRLRRGQQ